MINFGTVYSMSSDGVSGDRIERLMKPYVAPLEQALGDYRDWVTKTKRLAIQRRQQLGE